MGREAERGGIRLRRGRGRPEAHNGRRFRRREVAWCDQHAWVQWSLSLAVGTRELSGRLEPGCWAGCGQCRAVSIGARTNVCALLSATKKDWAPNAGGCGQL